METLFAFGLKHFEFYKWRRLPFVLCFELLRFR